MQITYNNYSNKYYLLVNKINVEKLINNMEVLLHITGHWDDG